MPRRKRNKVNPQQTLGGFAPIGLRLLARLLGTSMSLVHVANLIGKSYRELSLRVRGKKNTGYKTANDLAQCLQLSEEETKAWKYDAISYRSPRSVAAANRSSHKGN